MKKPILTILLAFVCISFLQAQNANTSKKAMLMGNGATVTDLKTGEVQRTTNSSISISEVPINGKLTIIKNNGTATPTGNAPINAKSTNSTLQLTNKNGTTKQTGALPSCNEAELHIKDANAIEKNKTEKQPLNSKLKHSSAYLNELERLKKLPPQQKEENK